MNDIPGGGQIVGDAARGLQLWGGVECTVNRVGNTWHSQLDRNGHADRIEDLDRFASLGLRAIRYPVLWERTAPTTLRDADWSWSDVRLNRLRELSLTPIVGLVHHGSGPAHTSLADPTFADKLAAYAGAVAERYPWVADYTPVNEPLTTARFSGLYGYWYPHSRTEPAFATVLLNQCKGIVLSMAAIRRIQPRARLVQTDDLGKTYALPALQYQADFNNHLRWLAWDLLCGRVDDAHPLWTWLIERCHVTPAELRWFEEHTCTPDVLGINYYATSERVLDMRLELYSPRQYGGNEQHRYVDIEASRCLHVPTGGIGPLLDEAWQRYRLPMAITEVHIDATREDQLRWLIEIWQSAGAARDRGVDVSAVTVWSLLGSYDWNSAVTEARGYYEPGAFDLRSPDPRPTAIAHIMRELATAGVATHPALDGAGWWRRQDRFFAEPLSLLTMESGAASAAAPTPTRSPILITGATGTLGRAFARICEQRGLRCVVLNRQQLDIADVAAIESALERYAPWVVINAAGYVRVDDAEADADRCFRENATGPGLLAAICARHGTQLVTFSTDLVFNGRRDCPYVEDDAVAPLNVYGRSKASAEQQVLEHHPQALVVRTSAFFGPWDTQNLITVALRALRAHQPFMIANDITVSPTYVPDLVHACLDLAIDRECGIWHLTNAGAVTWSYLVHRAADLACVDSSALRPRAGARMRFAARRPAYSALGSKRSSLMPSLDSALMRYLSDMHVQYAAPDPEPLMIG